MNNHPFLTTIYSFLFVAAGLVGMEVIATAVGDVRNRGLADSQQSCPTISVSCPDYIRVGEPLTFKATVNSHYAKIVPTYQWSVSSGSIIEGDGTPTIKVDATATGGQVVTATVSIGGFEKHCATTASCTGPIVEYGPPAVKIDSYGNAKSKHMRKKCVRRRAKRRD